VSEKSARKIVHEKSENLVKTTASHESKIAFTIVSNINISALHKQFSNRIETISSTQLFCILFNNGKIDSNSQKLKTAVKECANIIKKILKQTKI